MKPASILLLILVACNQPKSQGDKFYIKLLVEVGSVALQGPDIIVKTDSVVAPTAMAAMDSLVLKIYGWQYVDSISRDNYGKAGNPDYYNRSGFFRVKSAILYDHAMIDITHTIPDSTISRLVAKRRVDLANVSIGRMLK